MKYKIEIENAEIMTPSELALYLDKIATQLRAGGPTAVDLVHPVTKKPTGKARLVAKVTHRSPNGEVICHTEDEVK